MSRTIEEIKDDLMYLPNAFASEEGMIHFKNNLNELIETVATLQRKKCAEKGLLNLNYNQGEKVSTTDIFYSIHGEEITVDKESILNTKL
jgi:hypothetical protein